MEKRASKVSTGSDLADQLILARASRLQALPVLTFDARFSTSEGVEMLKA